jgi:hypothetical protein
MILGDNPSEFLGAIAIVIFPPHLSPLPEGEDACASRLMAEAFSDFASKSSP